jgi:NAD(P)-dependent dehydrogenase (short-subunit alcohol dehydrogenase family)
MGAPITRTALQEPPRLAELAGSVALISGAGRGLGRVLAEALADAGAAVGLLARSADELAAAAQHIRTAGGVAATATADVSDQDETANAFAELQRQLGPADLLINNAAIGGPVGPAWMVDPELWWRTLEVNLRGVFICSRSALAGMIARKHGRIINITSQAGVFRWPQVSAYSVSKAAVVKFTENLAAETRRDGVHVFSVHPGIIPIGLSEAALAAKTPAGPAEARMHSWVRRQLAAGRGADPACTANLVIRVAAGQCDALSGRHLSVHDDIDALLSQIDRIRGEDLYLLRTRNLLDQDRPAVATGPNTSAAAVTTDRK